MLRECHGSGKALEDLHTPRRGVQVRSCVSTRPAQSFSVSRRVSARDAVFPREAQPGNGGESPSADVAGFGALSVQCFPPSFLRASSMQRLVPELLLDDCGLLDLAFSLASSMFELGGVTHSRSSRRFSAAGNPAISLLANLARRCVPA